MLVVLGCYRWRAQAATSVVKRERKRRLEAEKAMIITKERRDAQDARGGGYSYHGRHRFKAYVAGNASLKNRTTEVYRYGSIRDGSSSCSNGGSIDENVSIRVPGMEKRDRRGSMEKRAAIGQPFIVRRGQTHSERRGAMEERVFDGLQRSKAMTTGGIAVERHSRNVYGQTDTSGRRLGRKASNSDESTGMQDEGDV